MSCGCVLLTHPIIPIHPTLISILHPAVSQLDVEWYPKEKVQQAKKKLIGGNPVHIMR